MMKLGIGDRIANRLFFKRPTKGIDYDAYDKRACEELAARLLKEIVLDNRGGSAERSRRILQAVGDSYPTEALTREYFANLDVLLRGRKRLASPGLVVLGLGTGRCGSTTLAEILGTIEDSCCTHENPPLVFWTPEREQIDFHVRRLKALTEFYALVADVSHWWLNSFDSILDHFPNARVIGLVRETAACVKSFMKIKGRGPASYNHWVSPGNGVWCAAHWDPTYPSYESPANSATDPDGAKRQLIDRYVRTYNQILDGLVQRLGTRAISVRTEDLGQLWTQEMIFQFVGLAGRVTTRRLNAGGIADGRDSRFKL